MAHGGRAGADETLVALLAGGASRQQAAQSAGVGVRTVFRRLEDPAFRARIEEARADMLARTSALLSAAGTAAAGTLVRLLQAESDQVKLAAASRIIELAGKLRTDVELEARIAALEDVAAPGAREGVRRWGT